VLGTDLSGCVEKAVKTWLAGGVPPSRCARSPLLVQQVPSLPASVASVAPIGTGGLRGRTLNAVSTTVREAVATWGIAFGGFSEPPARLAGPYAGTVRISGLTFSLAGYSAVPGLRLSGTLHVFRPSSGITFPLRFVGAVRVAGPKAARGSLTVGRRTIA